MRWLLSVCFVVCVVTAAHAENFVVFPEPGETTKEQLVRHLNAVGQDQLRRRAEAVAKISTRGEFEQRKKEVREKILRLIGGLPDHRGPLNVQRVEVLDRGDYKIEKIIYESLPGFHIPANVYVPAKGSGPFPAVLMPVGHSQEGKYGEQRTAVSLAQKGIIALKFDPVGQGERVQYYDPDLVRSKVGGATDEHTHSNGHTVLIGENLARYRIWDGMRGIDYLLTRKDVDGERIGCTGCSGGGTLTAYISALDDRVKVSVPSCYITSWEELLATIGPQDAEQTFPNFLSEGLNIADFVGLFAPKPLLIASTIEDFFSLEGARQTYMEARGIYELYGAGDRLGWFVGPGPHGVPLPVREAIYEWFVRWLKDGDGDRHEQPAKMDPPENLLCTPTGQVADSLQSETVFTLTRKRAADLIPPKPAVASPTDVDRLRTRLAEEIRATALTGARPGGAPPEVNTHRTVLRDGYRIDAISYEAVRGVSVPGVLLRPDGGGRRPAVLVVDARPKQVTAAPGGDLENLAKAGHVVLAIQPRGVAETVEARRPSLIGDYSIAFRAMVVGKTLVGMRIEDIVRAVDYLVSRPDVDPKRVTGFGHGAMGVALLHAAVLDTRIGRLVLQETLAAYRLAVDRPVHRDLYEVAIPGVLLKYDLDELLLAVSPRPVTVLNPVDALSMPLRTDGFRRLAKFAIDADARLGRPDRIRVEFRGRRDPLRLLAD